MQAKQREDATSGAVPMRTLQGAAAGASTHGCVYNFDVLQTCTQHAENVRGQLKSSYDALSLSAFTQPFLSTDARSKPARTGTGSTARTRCPSCTQVHVNPRHTLRLHP